MLGVVGVPGVGLVRRVRRELGTRTLRRGWHNAATGAAQAAASGERPRGLGHGP